MPETDSNDSENPEEPLPHLDTAECKDDYNGSKSTKALYYSLHCGGLGAYRGCVGTDDVIVTGCN